ncbi:hypothetical protein PP175_28675 (plasmid) [Aneurinibacillus sp. Ricciae_BoGa-3]|uniref:hypothetical protein n=1 Tax=Aneurinibacillus sp. Ricciae_BoGa-3 TaxID=3022697 RepID=UPI00233FDCCE|nr:hypothetical protein [Aneurinibacillus sp. Ricciae_BoGa-3]WCK57165.1 hypothetical protein PP175_28675 [Aneurinibacillus sp. Ricciae_BoGa-3]
MKDKNKNLKRTKNTLKVLMGTSILASSLMTGQAFASTNSNLIEKNHFGGEVNAQVDVQQVKNVLNIVHQKETNVQVPLVKSVTPAIGSTVVSPNQDVVFQLEPNAKEYKLASQFLSKGMIGAYLMDAKTLTPLDNNHIEFDSATGKLTVKHAVLDRYTQYAIVLDIQHHGFNKEDKQKTGNKEDNKSVKKIDVPSLDVVTAVDTTADSITLLGHGTVSFGSDKQVPLSKEAQNEKYKEKSDEKQTNGVKIASKYKFGDVVKAFKNPASGRTQIAGKDRTAIATFFTTGSAIGEATHVSAQVENASVKVTDGGKLNVNVTDDYGNPATNATLTVTGTGAGNAKVASAFATPDAISITNGTGSVPLSDHSAETVSLSYTVQDNIYKDVVDTQKGSVSENFLPGLTGKIQVINPQKIIAGENADFTGEADDIYGNAVLDGTQMNVSAQNATVSNLTPTTNGAFSFTVKAPTKAGASPVNVTGADSGYGVVDSINVSPGQANKAVLNVPSTMTVGQNVSVTGTLKDKYDNAVGNQTITVTGALKGTVTADANGALSGSLNVVSDGAVNANINGTSILLANSAGQSVTVSTQASNSVKLLTNTILWDIYCSPYGSNFYYNPPRSLGGLIPLGDLSLDAYQRDIGPVSSFGRITVYDRMGRTYSVTFPNTSYKHVSISANTLRAAGLRDAIECITYEANVPNMSFRTQVGLGNITVTY